MVKNRFIAFGLAAGLLMTSGVGMTQAQGPGAWGGPRGGGPRGGGPRGGGPGGWGGPGGGMAMRNSPKARLSGLWRNLGELQKSKVALSRDQAKRVVALVRPWGSRPSMTDSQAQSLHTRIGAVLTSAQKEEMKKMALVRRDSMRGGGPGGPRGGGSGGPGGWGGPRGGPGSPGGPRGGREGMDPQRMQQMRTRMQGLMKTMNPFYPPTSYKEIKELPPRMQQRFTRRYDATRAVLTSLVQKAA